jgi:siroheme synthase
MRGVSSSIAITTAEHDLGALAAAAETLVVLMAHGKLAEISATLAQLLGPGRPAAVVANATLPEQQVVFGTIGDVARKATGAGLRAPATLVVGEVVAQAASSSAPLVDLARFG